MKSYQILSIVMCLSLVGADDCNKDKSDQTENNDVENQQKVYVTNQKVPFFDWSLERHLMIQLYTARNKAATTYTYMFNPYNGKLVLVCASLGFPIPATTQLTNPIKLSGYNTSVALPQAEPNGLYSPPSTHGTWVMCMGQGGQVEPAYIEQDVLAFTRPMQGEAVQAIVPQEGGKPSITLNPNR